MINQFLQQSLIGVGSSEVESLSSYFARWAIKHGYSIDRFYKVLRMELQVSDPDFPIFDFPGRCLKTPLTKPDFRHRWLLEAMLAVGADPTLARLDLDRLSPVIKIPDRWFRQTMAWCPECIRESEDNAEQPYHRLLWTFSSVKACPKHWVYLEQRCPHCSRCQNGYCWKAPFTRCKGCGQRLVRKSRPFFGQAERVMAARIADIQDLVEAIATGWQPDSTKIGTSLFRHLVINGDIEKVESRISSNPVYLGNWGPKGDLARNCHHLGSFNLEELLHTATHLGVPLMSFFSTEEAPIQKNLPLDERWVFHYGGNVRPIENRYVNDIHVKAALDNVLRRDKLPGPPYMAARAAGISAIQLRTSFPNYYYEYSTRWKHQQAAKPRDAHAELAAEVQRHIGEQGLSHRPQSAPEVARHFEREHSADYRMVHWLAEGFINQNITQKAELEYQSRRADS